MGRHMYSTTIDNLNIPWFLTKHAESQYDYILNNAKKFIKRLPRKYSNKFKLVNLTFHESSVTIQYVAADRMLVDVLRAILILWFKRWTHCWCCGHIVRYNVHCNDTLGAVCSYVWRQENEQLKDKVAEYLAQNLKSSNGTLFTLNVRHYLDGNWDEEFFAETFYWGLGEDGWDCVFTIAAMLEINLAKFNPYAWIAIT